MHALNPIDRSKTHLGRIGGTDAFRAMLILTVLAVAGAALSTRPIDPDLAPKPAAEATGIEDWHGNVARSRR